MMTELSRGVLIAIEGIDGAGKTTQAGLLCDTLQAEGLAVSVLKEPTSGKWGQRIRELALNGRHKVSPDEELQLFIEDRKEDVEQNIGPRLDGREVVIMDRYYISSIAYQGALGLDSMEIRARNEAFAPIPDLVVLLDVAPRLGISRIQNGRREMPNHFEKEKYLEEVRKQFLTMADDARVQQVDASRALDTVAANIRNIAQDIIRPVLVAAVG